MKVIFPENAQKVFMFIVLICIGQFFSTRANADNTQYTRVKIYFSGWNLGAERRFPEDWTRAHYQALFDFKDPLYISQFVSWLDLQTLKNFDSSKVKSSMLPWLVIDLYSATGISTYYSDGCYIFSNDGKFFKPVNATFRDKFSFYNFSENKKLTTPLAKELALACND